jgi:hypothetical protein
MTLFTAIAWIVGCAVFGGAVGAAWDFLVMSDEDTQAAADWLRNHSHPRLQKAFSFLVRVRKRVRRQFGIKVAGDTKHVHIVREETLSQDQVPQEVRAQMNREGEVVFDATEPLKQALY